MTQLMDPAGLKPINLCTPYQPQTSTLACRKIYYHYSQRTIKVLMKLSGMICTFIVGISQKWESVILILILFGTYDMYIMVYKSSNYKQWPGIVFWYSQIQNPVQTKIKTLKYFNYVILSSTNLFFFFLQLFDCIYVCLYIWNQSTRQALLLKRKIYFRWNIGTDHDLAVYVIINEKVDDTVLVDSFVQWSIFAVW